MRVLQVLVLCAFVGIAHCLPPQAIGADASQKADALQPQGNAAAGVAQPVDNYVPHATYPYADTYPNSGYDNYLMPANYPPAGEYVTNMMPAANTALQVVLKIFAKVGLFLVGGVALLIVGGMFTTALCAFSPLCEITFAGMSNIDKDTVRSFVTPDKLSQAAGFVQDAVHKYQRLQRAIAN